MIVGRLCAACGLFRSLCASDLTGSANILALLSQFPSLGLFVFSSLGWIEHLTERK